MYAILLPWTIWRLSSPSTEEVVIKAYQTVPVEPEHYYQKVLGRVWAYNEKEALAKYKENEKSLLTP